MSKCPCGKKKSGVSILNCEAGWWHAVCASFNKDVTKKQLESLGQWRCPVCVISVIQIPGYNLNSKNQLTLKMEEQLDELKSQIADLKKVKETFAKICREQTDTKQLWSDIVGNIPNGKASFASTVAKEVADYSAKAVQDRKSRENNAIIFNAKESDDETASERQHHDQQIFDDVCNWVNDVTLPVGKVSRIGSKKDNKVISVVTDADIVNAQCNDDGPVKPRPMKVCFSSVADKRKFLSSLSKLRNAPSDIKNLRIQHDLSPDERKQTKALLAEAYKKNREESPADFYTR